MPNNTPKEEQRYNKRVRQAISDKYVEYSKRYAETNKELLIVKSRIKSKDSKKQMSYEEYVDLSKYLHSLEEELKELRIQINVWDMAREICLDIADEK